ncbi:Molecular chaperone IbpA, HSP20 family [Halopelagius inordinatus]|uniref:Molecular chaperone IbpA, HSP20 family n=1 Tax=Halopelagius inordinatus TaxID=553467 RepID=A0A1I2TGL6_9EURY|nr:gas vesicle protein GvpH [Halopelagius inordinatus]SFG61451.1 Molecular chaperone IbpA, HSP20 family [Halopelagius inordinatus]
MHDENDPNDDENRSDDRDGVSLGAGFRALTNVLSALGNRGRNSGSGLFDTDRSSVEYRYSVDTGLNDRPDRDGPKRTPRTERSRTKRHASADLPSTVSHEGDTAVVTVDLSDFDPDDVKVGLDDGELVVTVDGRRLDRIPIDLPSYDRTNARINNGVLQVRIHSDEAGGDD